MAQKIIQPAGFGKRSSAENFRADDAFGNFRHAADHADGEGVADFDFDDAAGTVDGNIFVHEAEFVRDRRGGAAAAAAGQRVARAAFPDLNLEIRAIQNFHELHVGLARKVRMDLQQRAEFFRHRFADFREGASLRARRLCRSQARRARTDAHYHHAVRIANGRRAKGELTSADGDFFIDDFGLRAGHGNFLAVETDVAHLDARHFAAIENRRAHNAAVGLEGKLVVAHNLRVPEVARKDADTVATLLRDAAVGIVNLQRTSGGARGQGTEQDAVRADAEVAVADGFDLFGGERRGKIFWINDDVVVAERVIFGESNVHRLENSAPHFQRKTDSKATWTFCCGFRPPDETCAGSDARRARR